MSDKKYVIDIFSGDGIDSLISACEEKKRWLEEKTEELAKRLADMGALYAEYGFEGALYSGEENHTITVEAVGENAYKVRASGTTVLFVEFGAGIRHGGGHPEAGENQMGPGTYPGEGHWDDPNGWFYEVNDPAIATYTGKRSGRSFVHTYGNPPAMPMYSAVKTLEEELESVIREVFAS